MEWKFSMSKSTANEFHPHTVHRTGFPYEMLFQFLVIIRTADIYASMGNWKMEKYLWNIRGKSVETPTSNNSSFIDFMKKYLEFQLISSQRSCYELATKWLRILSILLNDRIRDHLVANPILLVIKKKKEKEKNMKINDTSLKGSTKWSEKRRKEIVGLV